MPLSKMSLNPKPLTPNPKPPNPRPQTLNPQPQTLNLSLVMRGERGLAQERHRISHEVPSERLSLVGLSDPVLGPHNETLAMSRPCALSKKLARTVGLEHLMKNSVHLSGIWKRGAEK